MVSYNRVSNRNGAGVALGAGAVALSVAALAATTTVVPAARALDGNGLVQIAQCNPCKAKGACGACNPCAAANPCNLCNPCAAARGAASERVVPRLAANPCAAANPCNPCAAKNPCSPCAAKNPCNPCAAANPCNPCSPCGAAAAVSVSTEEAAAAYDCLIGDLRDAYAGSDVAAAKAYLAWPRYSTAPYDSVTHGGQYVNNYASPGAPYGKYEEAGTMPVGTVLAKDSFSVSPSGQVNIGPLFLMEKMPAGFSEVAHDWKYTMIMPGGQVFGVTNGTNSEGMNYCYECHVAAADHDDLFFMPEEFRAR